MGNWTIIIHGVGTHGIYPPRADAKNVEQSAIELVEKLRADGQSVSDCHVIAGSACGLAGATRTALGTLESYDARQTPPTAAPEELGTGNEPRSPAGEEGAPKTSAD